MRTREPVTAELLDIPMSALIDVVFLLLVYFVLTQTQQMLEAHLAVTLPSPDRPTRPPPFVPQPFLELQVRPGQVLLQGVPRSLSTIRADLATLARFDPEQAVIIKSHVMAKTEELVAVLDLCKGVGLTRLSLMTLK
ncbi:MAG: hypothetical protein A3K19_15310 [Lentisphaerae bacterium RIFOXYB12_FULL_65_16]|nr:MAG: hypothetical protein A3K18_01805 [Lentisphaerae bacterium RIFOXYA12_64_32]OGV88459.1 MAG: hypothetical protein A3K19_15310 [Lentisphaerae bacterium RIFOXYB12_FULL_65_16]